MMSKLVFMIMLPVFAMSQSRHNPIVKDFGGIYEISEATVKADPSLEYKVVIDIYAGSENPGELNSSLVNTARLMNLHGIDGIAKDNLHVVLVIHGSATYALMNNDSYLEKFKTNNPNLPLIKSLKEANAKLVVCGQSLISRGVNVKHLANSVEIGTSMLTTVTTYQLKGYSLLKF